MSLVVFPYDILVTFLAGLATVSSPCALPFAPIILTYYLQDQRSALGAAVGGVVVLAGLVTFAIPFLLLISVFGVWITPSAVTPYIEAIAGVLLLVFGGLTIFNVRTPFFVPSPTLRQDRGYRTLFTLGFLYGLAGIGCTIWPILSVGLLASTSALSTTVLYSIYVGTVAAPVLIMAFFAAEIRDIVVDKVAKYRGWIRAAAGTSLLAAGMYLVVFGFTFEERSGPGFADIEFEEQRRAFQAELAERGPDELQLEQK